MPRYRTLCPLVLLFTLASCTPAAKTPEAPPDPTALRGAIQAREREWSAAFLAGNASGVAALYTQDGAQVQSSGDANRGRDGITKAMQAQFDTVAVTAREDITDEVFPAGDYSYQGTSKKDNKPVSASGRYMVLWRKDADGVWRLHRDIGSEAPPKKP